MMIPAFREELLRERERDIQRRLRYAHLATGAAPVRERRRLRLPAIVARRLTPRPTAC